MTTLSPFGARLREWRKRRGFSQLDLAIEASTTPRHVSFIETGRSRPGRDLVQRLIDALQLPLREGNALLIAAGLEPVYSELPVDDDALSPVRHIIDRVLESHNPYPAFVFAPGLRILGANRTAETLFPGMSTLTPAQLIQAWCTPRPGVPESELRTIAHQLVATLRRELFAHPHPALPELLELAEGLARELGSPPVSAVPSDDVVLSGTIRTEGRAIKTIATVLRFDRPIDVTVAELRVELIFPADSAADEFFQSLVLP